MEDDDSHARVTLPMNKNSKDNNLKVLGLVWDNAHDTFVVNVAKLRYSATERPSTKRNSLALLVKVVDPFGLIWIKGHEGEWKLFVQNRVQQIRKRLHQDLWEHCPGTDNPADIPTRNIGIVNVLNESQWIQCPEWLSMDEPHWPERTLPRDLSEDCIKEMKPKGVVGMLVVRDMFLYIKVD